MIRANGRKRSGFTLVELLVVIGMIALIMGAMTTSVNGARKRARVQKALNDVKVVSQAILAYENYASGYELPTMNRQPVGRGSLGFLLGDGDAPKSGGKLPVLLEAALTEGGQMLDPWGHPYLVTIKKGSASMKTRTVTGALNTGYYLPNYYRISESER